MGTNKKRYWVIVMIVCALLMVAACSNTTETESNGNEPTNEPGEAINNEPNEESGEPEESEELELEEEDITLHIYTQYSSIEDDYRSYLEDEFPHITFEFVTADPADIEELTAANQPIDIYYLGSPSSLIFLREVDLTRDLADLIERHNYDLSLFREGNVDVIRSFSAPGALEGLPQRGIPYILHYNQDIFDQFGVNYPTNNMTWNEVIDLAREVTMEEDNVRYYGLLPRVDVMPRTLQNSTILDPETNEPLFQSDDFISTFTETWDTLYSIPGILPPRDDVATLRDSRGIWSEGQLAMHPTWEQLNQALDMEEESGISTDIVTFPQWEEYPGLTPEADTHVAGVANHTEHEDWAFKVLEYMVSPDYHYANPQFATSARLAFADREILDNYETPPEYDHFNLDAFHELANAPGPAQRSRFEGDARNDLMVQGDFFEELAYGEKDVNTILREYDELAEELVRQLESLE